MSEGPRPELRTIGDQLFAVDRFGDAGPFVFLLPGLGGGTNRLASFARLLAATGRQVVAVHPRGAGGSTGDLEALTLHDLASDLAAVAIDLDVSSAVVIGVAFGSRVARCLAGDEPAFVQALVLIGAGGEVAPEPAIIARLSEALDDSLPEAVRLEAARQALFAPAAHVSLDFLRDNRNPETAAAQVAAIARTPDADRWEARPCPALVIQGAFDRVAPPANGHRLRERVGDGVRVIDIDNAGHAVLDEKPEVVAAHVVAFLDELRTAN